MNLINRFRLLRFLLLAAILLFPLSSCTTLPERRVKPDYTVAVLPLYNATADLDGPVLVRRVFNDKIRKYYKTMPLKDVDRLLRDQMGITLGGQLEMTTPQKLGEVLGVDAVIYGYLLNFDDITAVVYNARKVRAGFKLVDAKTGQTLWARGQGVRSFVGLGEPTVYKEWEPSTIKGLQDIPGINEWHNFISIGMKPQNRDQAIAAASVAVTSAVLSLGVHSIGNIFNIHLITETTIMVDKIADTIGTERGVIVSTLPVLPKPQIPRLIFPAYSFLKDRNFIASMTMRTINKSTNESITESVGLFKLDDKLRSNRVDRVTGEPILSVIVKKDEKKGYLLYHDKKEYFEMAMEESLSKETAIVKEFVGEEEVDNQLSEKYKVRVTHSDGYTQEGYIWEAKSLNSFPIKVEVEDKEMRTIIEFKNVSFGSFSANTFEPPGEYTKIIINTQ